MLAAGCLAAACSTGDDGGGNGQPNPPGAPSDEVTVSGIVTFDFVPSRPGECFVYADTEQRPVRGATVQAVADDVDGTVLATTTTSDTGAYSLGLAANQTVFLRVRAEMIRTGTPAWDVRVVDNTDGNAPYVLDGAPFATGDTDSTRDVNAPSGWTGAGYTNPRSAGPFAILDTAYASMQLVLAADSGLTFPPLVVHWSPNNVPTDGNAPGEIGSSLYRHGVGIFLLGSEDADADEYDRHVVAHEWGHYFEHTFSRSDSVGGRHGLGDALDLRTAFGEGFGNALSGMVTGSPFYTDSTGTEQPCSFGFDLEGAFGPGVPNPNPGWFSEQSVHEMLWDLHDSAPDGVDTISIGFAPIYEVLTGPQVVTPALTSVFSFLDALKAARPDGDDIAIDMLASANDIEPVVDAFGTGEDNDAGSSEGNVLPVYLTDLAVGGPAVNVCSTNEFGDGATGAAGKLGSRRFLRLPVETLGPHTITVTTTQTEGAYADPDFVVHRRGAVVRFTGAPSDPCEQGDLAQCVETGTPSLVPGEHVLEVYEWTNIGDNEEDFPPVGLTCFDVEVTGP